MDIAFNYKREDTRKILAANPIDSEPARFLAQRSISDLWSLLVYWDNVGGPTLDAALEYINEFGRVVACGSSSLPRPASFTRTHQRPPTGQISTYNGEEYGVKNTGAFFAKSLKMEGCVVAIHHG